MKGLKSDNQSLLSVIRRDHNSDNGMKAPNKSAALILIGLLWIYYATLHAGIMQSRAVSNAMQMAGDLGGWAQLKTSQGRLSPREVKEILSEEEGTLRFSMQNRNWNLVQMVVEVSDSASPPVWPGIIAVLVGVWPAGFVLGAGKKKPAAASCEKNRQMDE